MNLKFCGAAGAVTGSRYLLTHDGQQTLVDCGLFQGQKQLRQRNWEELPFDASKVGTVFLTHAHIDHSGYLPVLVRRGFKGPIVCTKVTLELCQLLLRDSAHLQEEFFCATHEFSIRVSGWSAMSSNPRKINSSAKDH